MGFFEQASAGFVLTHLLSNATAIITVLRWAAAWALAFTHSADDNQSSSRASSQLIRDNLVLATFGDIADRLPETHDTCAVCLGRLKSWHQVRQLRNCCHVFHKGCIDRWVDHDRPDRDDDHHSTCPLCRAPLVTPSQTLGLPTSEPSWAVERLLYLFGDDLPIH